MRRGGGEQRLNTWLISFAAQMINSAHFAAPSLPPPPPFPSPPNFSLLHPHLVSLRWAEVPRLASANWQSASSTTRGI